MLVGISGALIAPSGNMVGMKCTGKDTVADFMCEKGFVKVGLADPMKRVCQDVFAFSDAQLWGPSEKREEPDKRYPTGRFRESHWLCTLCAKAAHGEVFEEKTLGLIGWTTCAVCGERIDAKDAHYVPMPEFLTPRYALQTLGTEWGRDCYPNVWIDYAIRVHQRLQEGECCYDAQSGLRYMTGIGESLRPKIDVVIPDVRFRNEISAIKKAGGKVVRVVRPIAEEPAEIDMHPSEQEALKISVAEFDYMLMNDGDKNLLRLRTHGMLDWLNGRMLAYDPDQADVPPFKRKQ